MKNRRTFLKVMAAALAAAGHGVPASALQSASTAGAQGSGGPIRKSTLISMLPKERPYAERFAIARDAGFRRHRDADDRRGRRGGGDSRRGEEDRPAGSLGDEHGSLAAAAVEQRPGRRQSAASKGMETSLRNAALWGADTVLLVPAVVDATTSYRDA